MRLRIKLTGDQEYLLLPIHHNEILQGIIYRHLDPQIAERIHEHGIKDPYGTRSLKLFTFSRLIGSRKPRIDLERRTIKFSYPISWVIASPLKEFIISLCNNLRSQQCLQIKGPGIPDQDVYVSSVLPEVPPHYKSPVVVETLSPITVYRTEKVNGKNFTRYLSPHESEFSELVLSNLARKYRTLSNDDFSLDEQACIKPLRINKRENIVYYKGTIVKGWSGVFELSLPPEIYPLAFAAGLGSRNSQGFGCIGIWRGHL